MKYKKLFLLFLIASFFSCTKLDEKIRDNITFDQAAAIANPNALLKSSYDGLQEAFIHLDYNFALSEHSTDEAIPPTRGKDWDDNGVWRQLHNHTWNSENARVRDGFVSLLKIVFNTTNTLNFKPPAQTAAEAKFLRAFAMFAVLDLYGQVPYRAPGANLLLAPEVLSGAQALDTIITQTTSIIPALPDGPAYKATKDAARVLLMKCYLNKAVFLNRESPAFVAADMNQVITLANAIATSTRNYSLSGNYYDNFSPTNETVSPENIFTHQQGPSFSAGRSGNNVKNRWFATLHYNQKPSGWNGFTTLAEFYDKFGTTDKRRGDAYPGLTDVTGFRVGFLIGQQFDQNGTALKDGFNNPLAFTRDVRLIESGNSLEVTGIRVVKYAPDLKNPDDPENDFVFYRYADVLLMKAEAILRGGTGTPTALILINQVRARSGATPLLSATLNDVYDERGRELYWESSRRQDMIRFGKFLAPFAEKPQTSDKKYLLYPIPAVALAVNPNLKQNPGY